MSWRLFWIITNFFLLISFDLQAAIVNSIQEITPLNFGKVIVNNGGTINSSNCSVSNGDLKGMGGCSNATFKVNYVHSGGRTTIKIFFVANNNILSAPIIPVGGTVTTSYCNNTPSNSCIIYDVSNPAWSDKGADITFNLVSKLTVSTSTNLSTPPKYQVYACSCCAGQYDDNPFRGEGGWCSKSLGLQQPWGCPSTYNDIRCTKNGTMGPLNTAALIKAVTPLSIINNTDLSFGAFFSGNGGTITINVDKVVSSGVIRYDDPQNKPSVASFSISGEPNMQCAITFPSEATLYNDSGASMKATLSTNSSTTLSTNGSSNLILNGVLTVGKNQPVGKYQGAYTINVNYQ